MTSAIGGVRRANFGLLGAGDSAQVQERLADILPGCGFGDCKLDACMLNPMYSLNSGKN